MLVLTFCIVVPVIGLCVADWSALQALSAFAMAAVLLVLAWVYVRVWLLARTAGTNSSAMQL